MRASARAVANIAVIAIDFSSSTLAEDEAGDIAWIVAPAAMMSEAHRGPLDATPALRFRFLDNVKFKIMFAPYGTAEDDLPYPVEEQEEQAEIDARPGKLL